MRNCEFYSWRKNVTVALDIALLRREARVTVAFVHCKAWFEPGILTVN